jgi:hypothetical protein
MAVVMNYQLCPEYNDRWVWISGFQSDDSCSEIEKCHKEGRFCKFVSKYVRKPKE